jgi:hypothetical protein
MAEIKRSRKGDCLRCRQRILPSGSVPDRSTYVWLGEPQVEDITKKNTEGIVIEPTRLMTFMCCIACGARAWKRVQN